MARGVGRVLAGLALCALVAACGASPEAIERAQQDLASHASAVIHGDIRSVLDRLAQATRETGSALGAAPPDRASRFDALEGVLEHAGVDGVLWEGPGGEQVWAGTPIEATPEDAAPWRRSFRRGGIAYHDGPYVRALLRGPEPAAGGHVTVTYVLEASAPGAAGGPFAARWLTPLGLSDVRVEAPDAPQPPPSSTAVAFLVRDGDANVMRVVVTPPGADAVGDRIEGRGRTWTGVGLLALWLLSVGVAIAYIARRPPSPLRWLLAASLALLARALLVPLGLPDRFPSLAHAFDPSAFGIEDPLGWLASPADFLLTAVAGLLAAAFLFAAVRRARPTSRLVGRSVALVAGTALAGALSALWIATVSVAVAQSQIPFFEAPTVVPPLASALMLMGLVAATSGAWLLVAACLRVAQGGASRRRARVTALALVLVAGLLAWLLVSSAAPTWAPWLLPLTALPALLRPRREAMAPLPSSVLLIGVLATLILFPVLWNRVLARGAQGLAATVEDLLRADATALETTRFELEAVREDADVVAGLAASRSGLRPVGLAFHIWLRSFLTQPSEHGLVSVLSVDGRRLDEFTLTPLPRGSTPAPTPPASDDDGGEVRLVRGEGREVRSVLGRTWITSDEGERLGSVVFTVPARLDLVFLGPGAMGIATGDRLAPVGVHVFDLEFAILRRGEVVRTNTPLVSRERLSFGPPGLASLGPGDAPVAWQTREYEGYAAWSAEREAVIAIRRETPSPADTVLALARLVAVGVGLALLVAVVISILGLHRFRPRLQHRVFLSYFAFSFIPILLLGLATAREIRLRHDAHLAERLTADLRQARADFEAMGPQLFDLATDQNLVRWAHQGGHDVVLYRDGEVASTSRAGLLEAEILPRRLPPDAYLATQVERRELVRSGGSFAGRTVWTGYAPVLDAAGRVVATVGIPLLYDEDQVEEELAVTGSVLVAAYLFALVLVLVGGIFAARRLMRPLSELAAGTRRVAEGELDVELEVTGRDELGELVDAFNRMTHALKDATERAIRAERESAWRRMARQVAHEIKNPLTPIRLMIQQMQAEVERDPAGARALIERTAPVVLRQIESLGKIARDFAHFARMPTRTVEDIELGDLARDVVALYSGSAEQGIDVRFQREGDLPHVRWDAEELRRVLVNLVGNAVQAVPGRGHVEVRLSAARHDGRLGVRVEVRDSGIGIPANDLARIFEPDFSTKTEGTGLGLALVRRTVDDVGGTIDVDSVEGEGTTFSLWFPAADA